MKHQIFLSYGRRDRSFAGAVERELEKLGVTAFNPNADLKPGANFRESILDAIRATESLVVLWTPRAIESNWIGYEVGAASGLDKEIVVLKPESLSVRDLPADLTGWRVADFDPTSPAKTARTLVSSLAAAG